MPTLTNADALLNAAQAMSTAIKGGIPQTDETIIALQNLIDIFKENAKQQKQVEDKTNSQRVRMQNAREERVLQEVERENNTPAAQKLAQQYNIISQEIEEVDENDPPDSPATNTRARRTTRANTHNYVLAAMDITTSKITPKNASSRKFPLQFLCEYANAVLDGETGELLEYRHLIQRPKYHQVWGNHLATKLADWHKD
ncbi:hypothetical protein ACHAXR_001144 [Thalassiosira sp. AJA248-18]